MFFFFKKYFIINVDIDLGIIKRKCLNNGWVVIL